MEDAAARVRRVLQQLSMELSPVGTGHQEKPDHALKLSSLGAVEAKKQECRAGRSCWPVVHQGALKTPSRCLLDPGKGHPTCMREAEWVGVGMHLGV